MFREQIHAAYSEYTGWTGEKETPKWKYNLGLRAELAKNNGKTQNESQGFSNAYFNLFPSGSLLYYTKNRNNFKVSYSRRITRPGLGQLNPFIDITDSLNQHSGNPELKPELIHSMELEYDQLLSRGSVSLTAFYRIRRNSIFSYTALDSNGIALSRPANFGDAISSGIELIISENPFTFWNTNFSFSLFDMRIDSGGPQPTTSNHPKNWYAKLSNTFELFRNTKLQVIGSYTSATVIPQGMSMAVYYVDAGLQHKIMKEKGRLGLTVTDIFNTQDYGYTLADHNFEFRRRSKLDTRAVMFTFGYTFGSDFKEKLMENKFKND
jgi:outer membrane receptor protein involved in Fe transport